MGRWLWAGGWKARRERLIEHFERSFGACALFKDFIAILLRQFVRYLPITWFVHEENFTHPAELL